MRRRSPACRARMPRPCNAIARPPRTAAPAGRKRGRAGTSWPRELPQAFLVGTLARKAPPHFASGVREIDAVQPNRVRDPIGKARVLLRPQPDRFIAQCRGGEREIAEVRILEPVRAPRHDL